MAIRNRQPIGIELVKRGIVGESAIDQALQYQKEHSDKKIGEIIYLLDLCDPYKLIDAIGDIVGLKGMILNPEDVKVNILELIPLETVKNNKVIPFEIESGKIKVCFSDTFNVRILENIRLTMLNKGYIMEPFVTFETNIDKIISNLGGTVQNEANGRTIRMISQDGTITSLVDSVIKTGMQKRASDIHFEPLKDELRVRYRIDGELITATTIQKDKQAQIIGRLKAISNMHQEKQESQDGRIVLYEDYNIRVSSQKNIYGEKFVLRLLKKNSNIRNIFELGYTGTKEDLDKSVNKKNSMTIIAAPTGEGKTTTLYSILDYLNRPEINITTIEDPVEIRIDGLNQIEVDAKSGFSDSLRTILRQDPDVILVGEIRDKETAEIGVQAGQTGHYVLSTIHTIDAIEVITRLRKLGLSDYDIATTIATTISQRLVRKLCTDCRREREFSYHEKEVMGAIAGKYGINLDFENKKTYDAVGCPKCNNTGYFDRIAMFEIFNLTDEIKELIMNGKSSIEIRKKALEQNYKPLVIDGINKVLNGLTNLDELNKKLLIF